MTDAPKAATPAPSDADPKRVDPEAGPLARSWVRQLADPVAGTVPLAMPFPPIVPLPPPGPPGPLVPNDPLVEPAPPTPFVHIPKVPSQKRIRLGDIWSHSAPTEMRLFALEIAKVNMLVSRGAPAKPMHILQPRTTRGIAALMAFVFAGVFLGNAVGLAAATVVHPGPRLSDLLSNLPLASVGAGSLGGGHDGEGDGGAKADVCHLTGNGGSHTINVSVNAVPAHLAHGDALGACGGAPADVNQPPVALFNVDCSGLACLFDASPSSDPDGSIASYAWDFGDGGDAAGPSASHAYAADGSYNVSLAVVDDDGASANGSRPIQVSEASIGNAPPTADFTWACDGLACSFDGSLSSDADGSIVSYAWDFGNGSNGTGALASHGFAAPGVHNVTLTVSDDHQPPGSGQRSKAVSIPDGNHDPVADWTHHCVRLACTFDATDSSDPDGDPLGYTWDIDPALHGAVVESTFPAAGSHFVVLTVADPYGGLASSGHFVNLTGSRGGGGGGGGGGGASGNGPPSVADPPSDPAPDGVGGPGGSGEGDGGDAAPDVEPSPVVTYGRFFSSFTALNFALEASSGRRSHREGQPHGEGEDQGDDDGEPDEDENVPPL